MPAEMKADAYERTLKARAFDVARYLLPLATNTSLGQIVNARTLETQVSRLLLANALCACPLRSLAVPESQIEQLCGLLDGLSAKTGGTPSPTVLVPTIAGPA